MLFTPADIEITGCDAAPMNHVALPYDAFHGYRIGPCYAPPREHERSTTMARIDNAAEITELLRNVRQARQYKPQPVSDEVLDELLEIARWTGSSRNTQPWHFIVVNDAEKMRAISQLRTPINWVAEAPLAIAIVLNGASEGAEAYDEGRVTERLMIGAHVLGLGGGIAWFGDAEQEAEAKRVLGIPDERTARSVVVLGYPKSIKDPRPNPAQPGRRPISEVVSWNTFGKSERS